jgi:hypothetical protein
VVAAQPYRVTITHHRYDLAEIADLGGIDPMQQTKALRLVYDRLLAVDGGNLRPADPLLRIELARALALGARVPQFIPGVPSFTDLASGTPESLFAESLKAERVMGLDGMSFGPAAQVSRLEAAVALVRALRLEAQAKALANTTVTWQGQALTDNAAIPGPLRGHVQLALDRGLFQAFPAEVREIAPGQFEAIPGPRFEPARTLSRADAVDPLARLQLLLFGE